MGSAAEHTPSLGSWGLDLAYNSKLRSASHLSEINPLFSVMKLHFNHPKKLRESIADQCFDILSSEANGCFISRDQPLVIGLSSKLAISSQGISSVEAAHAIVDHFAYLDRRNHSKIRA